MVCKIYNVKYCVFLVLDTHDTYNLILDDAKVYPQKLQISEERATSDGVTLRTYPTRSRSMQDLTKPKPGNRPPVPPKPRKGLSLQVQTGSEFTAAHKQAMLNKTLQKTETTSSTVSTPTTTQFTAKVQTQSSLQFPPESTPRLSTQNKFRDASETGHTPQITHKNKLFIEPRSTQVEQLTPRVDLFVGDTGATLLTKDTFKTQHSQPVPEPKPAIKPTVTHRENISLSRDSMEQTKKKTILVKYTNPISLDLLELYLSNTKRSGGGEITHIEDGEDSLSAIVEFKDHKGKIYDI